MTSHYVLIDYENVQPKDISVLREGAFKIRVFLGPNQGKIPVNLAVSLQALGSNAEYILVETAGRNAMDFHIAYYIGVLSSREPSATFDIISKDTGFDSLVKHLNAKGCSARRSTYIDALSIPTSQPSLESQVQAATRDLLRRAASRPRTKKTLLSTLHALFRKQLSDQQLSALLDALCQQGIVRVDGTRVTYELPTAGGTKEESGGQT